MGVVISGIVEFIHEYIMVPGIQNYVVIKTANELCRPWSRVTHNELDRMIAISTCVCFNVEPTGRFSCSHKVEVLTRLSYWIGVNVNP